LFLESDGFTVESAQGKRRPDFGRSEKAMPNFFLFMGYFRMVDEKIGWASDRVCAANVAVLYLAAAKFSLPYSGGG